MTFETAQRQRRVDIGICTFRRPQVEETLRSLFKLVVPAGVDVRLIVADNDAEPSASGLVERLRAESPFDVFYIHCPKGNISIARNACLNASSGDYLAFIDDDETASPEWLAELLAVVDTTGADAVLGPVRAVYAADAPGWMRKGDFHSTRPVWIGGTIQTGYTCNVLIDMRSSRVRDQRFALGLGQSGGEDTHFFTRLTKAGGQIAFAEKAWLNEPVPPGRARLSWLAKRRFRSGQTHGRILAAQLSPLARAGHFGLALAKCGYCFASCAATFVSPVARNRNLLRGALHVGAMAGILGVREIRQYGMMEAA